MRRPLLVIALSLLLGFGTTIAVAWCVAWPHPHSLKFEGYGKRRAREASRDPFPLKWYASRETSFGVTSVSIRVDTGDEDPSPNEAAFHRIADAAPIREALRVNADRLLAPLGHSYSYTLWSFGWPARSLYYEEPFSQSRAEFWWLMIVNGSGPPIQDPSPFPEPVDAFAMAGSLHLAGNDLPARPLWSGLVTDITVYATLWYVLLFAAGRLHAARRRRKGLCSACAYDLAGLPAESPCPECGKPAH